MQIADKLLTALDAQMEREPRSERGYLGGSALGEPCHRKLWYDYRGFIKKLPPARVRRIFQMGEDVERNTLKRLRAIPGVQVLAVNPETGKQWEVSKHGGHVKGHYDGIIRAPHHLPTDEWYLLEIKSMKEEGAQGFRTLKKSGVRIAHPKYWAQMQFYMAESQSGTRPLSKALFYVENKGDSDVHAEIVEHEPMAGLMYGEVARKVIEASEPPAREYAKPEFFACRFCDHRGSCWEGAPVEAKDCRQCRWAGPDTTGGNSRWVCENPASPNHGRPCWTICSAFEGHAEHVTVARGVAEDERLDVADAGAGEDRKGAEVPAPPPSAGVQPWP
jgi:hypothetical protein